MLESEEDDAVMEFDLSMYLDFELRRGDEDSAPASELEYEVSVLR